jgi:hypothetical protein
MGARPERDLQQVAQSVYSNPCGCGRSYSDKTGVLLAVQPHKSLPLMEVMFIMNSKLDK